MPCTSLSVPSVSLSAPLYDFGLSLLQVVVFVEVMIEHGNLQVFFLGKERVDLLRALLQRRHGPAERGDGDGVGAINDCADVYPVVVRELGEDFQYKVLEHHHRVVGRAPHALRVLVHELPVDEREVDVIMKPPKEMVGRNENVIQSRILAQNEFLLLCNHASKLLKTNESHK